MKPLLLSELLLGWEVLLKQTAAGLEKRAAALHLNACIVGPIIQINFPSAGDQPQMALGVHSPADMMLVLGEDRPCRCCDLAVSAGGCMKQAVI